MSTVGEFAKKHPAAVGNWLLSIFSAILVVIVAAGAVGVSGAISDYGQQLASIQNDLKWIRRSMDDTYSRREAESAHARIFTELKAQQGDIASLKARVNALERQR